MRLIIKGILCVTLLLSWAVRTQPYTTKFGVERPILKAIVGEELFEAFLDEVYAIDNIS